MKYKCESCSYETDNIKELGKECEKCNTGRAFLDRHHIKYKDWGKGLSIYEKTRKAILEILSENEEMRKSSMYHQFWLRGFDTTSSALSKHLFKLCDEKKIIVVRMAFTYMCGDDSTYTLLEPA